MEIRDSNWLCDPAGFPMLRLPNRSYFVHWYPVTKIQFEHFLWAADAPEITQDLYESILAGNPRISPKEIEPHNYWRMFITGLQMDEIDRYRRWCNSLSAEPSYRLMQAAEWAEIYNELSKEPPKDHATLEKELSSLECLTSRARVSISGIGNAAPTPSSLMHQMLFENGVMEWATSDGAEGSDYVQYGAVRPNWAGSSAPYLPPNPLRGVRIDNRNKTSGFRLIMVPNV